MSICDEREKINMCYANKKPPIGDAYPEIKENNNVVKNVFFKYWCKNQNIIFFSICGEDYQKMMGYV